MSTQEIIRYFDATENRPTRDDVKLAVSLVEGDKVAIDCGCGSGSDIAYLRTRGFRVYAFDIDEQSILRCEKRFQGDLEIKLSRSSFNTYRYPQASLVVADASLFFCSMKDFDEVWGKITEAILPGGLFSGSFLGPEDTMAGPLYDKASYWPDILVLSEIEVKKLFNKFSIVSFTEHRSSGVAPDGKPHQWHIFSVVAKKLS